MEQLNVKKPEQTNDNGRSMVEMLGVLAVIGVLSIGGIAGYKYGMNRYQANQVLHEMNMASSQIAMQLQKGKAEGVHLSLDGAFDNNAFESVPFGFAFACGTAPDGSKDCAGEETRYQLSALDVPLGVCNILRENISGMQYYFDTEINGVSGGDCYADSGNEIAVFFDLDAPAAMAIDPESTPEETIESTVSFETSLEESTATTWTESTETTWLETISTETSWTETRSTDTTWTETRSTETSWTETRSTETTWPETRSTETTWTETWSTETSWPETRSTMSTLTDTRSTMSTSLVTTTFVSSAGSLGDCSDACLESKGMFCNSSSYSCTKQESYDGKCFTGAAYQRVGNQSGLVASTVGMKSWWSANSFCASLGKSLVSLRYLGCDKKNASYCKTAKVTQLRNDFGSNMIWTNIDDASSSECAAYSIALGFDLVTATPRYTSNIYAVCE